MYKNKIKENTEKGTRTEGDSPILRHKYRHKTFYCPMCKQRFDTSDYLSDVFKENEKALWLANMVTHYRHSHITSWNKYWGRYGAAYRIAAHFGDYDKEKAKVNERAKRQIARKCSKYIVKNGIDENVYSLLQGTTEMTKKVVNEVWGKLQSQTAEIEN